MNIRSLILSMTALVTTSCTVQTRLRTPPPPRLYASAGVGFASADAETTEVVAEPMAASDVAGEPGFGPDPGSGPEPGYGPTASGAPQTLAPHTPGSTRATAIPLQVGQVVKGVLTPTDVNINPSMFYVTTLAEDQAINLVVEGYTATSSETLYVRMYDSAGQELGEDRIGASVGGAKMSIPFRAPLVGAYTFKLTANCDRCGKGQAIKFKFGLGAQ